MKAKKERALARKLHEAAMMSSPGTIAVSIACHVAHQNHGIDSRDTLRAIGAKCLGPARADKGDGSKPIEGTVYEHGAGRYLRVSAGLVLDVSQAEQVTGRRLVDDLTVSVSAVEQADCQV